MNRRRLQVLIACAIATVCALIVLALINMRSMLRAEYRRSTYMSIRAGVTTENEITNVFGPPDRSYQRALTPQETRSRGLSPASEGRPVNVTMKRWWFDDFETFELEFDERGILVHKWGLAPEPPRSVFQWLRRHCSGRPAGPFNPD